MEREKIVGLGSKKPEQNTKSTVLKLKSGSQTQSSSKTGPWRKSIVSTKASLKKKSTKPKRLSVKTLFDEESETSDSGSSHPVQGSFLNLLPPQLEVPQHRDNSL
ncbi:PREDICTED: uncharacterized protein LOC103324829 isoform X3 [Prunus mume]|uniref:Uncharacterized protein LOC103324829 isoform X3 n=1 Tax=Prunus mume TaxID=102107 RepID=A0ABM1LM40_PRUMU|nr:PREDICTED: uncharacterized protein LOC103324829 isoform X3 [Prunus mume]